MRLTLGTPNKIARMIGCAVLCLLALSCYAVAAERPTFALPLVCEINNNCFIQQYVDVDSGPSAKDYTCGSVTYDGHKGTDFRVRTLKDAARGVAVIAAADGIVRALRDGELDRLIESERDRRAVADKECGNGVVINHGDGWETQYCHLRKGSVTVREGQRVRRGQQIGYVGFSGDAGFPHVHFQVRHTGQVIDPFGGRTFADGCDAHTAQALWQGSLIKDLSYETAQILEFGFAADRVNMQDLVAGTLSPLMPSRNAPALVIYVWLINLLGGDKVLLSISGPDGRLVTRELPPLERNRAQQMFFAGKRRPATGWPPGTYVGYVDITRDGKSVRRMESLIDIE